VQGVTTVPADPAMQGVRGLRGSKQLPENIFFTTLNDCSVSDV